MPLADTTRRHTRQDMRVSLSRVAWALTVLICLVVGLLFAASLTRTHLGAAVALLFVASMVAIAVGFAIFLVETRLGARSVRIRSELLQHRVDGGT